MSLSLRHIKGSPFTNTEIDDNFEYLEQLIAPTQYVIGPENNPGQQGISISIIDDIATPVVLPIASGEFSLATGNNSVASGYSSIALGNNSISSNISSVALGLNSKATGYNAIALGSYSEANGNNSIALGSNCKTDGSYATSMGIGAKAIGNNSVAMSAISRNDSELSMGVGMIGTSIQAQTGKITGKETSGGATPQKLKFGPNEYALIANDSSYLLNIKVLATDSTDVKEWSGKGVILNGSFVNTPTMTSDIETAGFNLVDVSVQMVSPLATENAIEVIATGVSGKTIKWAVEIDYIEITV